MNVTTVPMPASIRTALPADVDALLPLVQEAHDWHLQLYPESFKPLDKAALRSWLLTRLADNRTHVLIAQDDHRIVAYLLLKLVSHAATPFAPATRMAFIDQLCVSAAYRRQGIASALLAHAQVLADAAGHHVMELEMWVDNASARAFYEKNAFRIRHQRMRRD